MVELTPVVVGRSVVSARARMGCLRHARLVYVVYTQDRE